MNQKEEEISNSLTEILNIHGYSFQYAVIQRAKALFDNKSSNWRFVGAEIPVTINGQVIHVDFVFKHKTANIFLIGECKRAEPSRANWCFVRAPFTFSNLMTGFTFFDLIRHDGMSERVEYGCLESFADKSIYHLGFELKTGLKGDGIGGVKSNINSAISQVLRGSSGYINSIFKSHKIRNISPNTNYYFVPVIFTTAKIFSSENNIGVAKIEDGLLQKNSLQVSQNSWIWFNHNRSDELKHSLPHSAIDDIYQKDSKEYIRSIAIVSADGIDNFFKIDLNDYLL
jgi:hypothetical protein